MRGSEREGEGGRGREREGEGGRGRERKGEGGRRREREGGRGRERDGEGGMVFLPQMPNCTVGWSGHFHIFLSSFGSYKNLLRCINNMLTRNN